MEVHNPYCNSNCYSMSSSFCFNSACYLQKVDLDEISAFRRQRLLDFVNLKYEENKAYLGRALGYRDGAYIGQMIRGERPITEKTIAQINDLPGGTGWFALPIDAGNTIPVTVKKRIPLISWVRAGQWSDVQDNYHPGEADEWVDAYDTQPGDSTFALRVTGDSMTSPYPGDRSFPDGTIIIVDPGRASNAGDYVVAKDVETQQATFKRLVHDGGRWFLKPLNPSYPTQAIDDPSIRVIGRVIEFQTRGKL